MVEVPECQRDISFPESIILSLLNEERTDLLKGRKPDIAFDKEFCIVSLGHTKVTATVSCCVIPSAISSTGRRKIPEDILYIGTLRENADCDDKTIQQAEQLLMRLIRKAVDLNCLYILPDESRAWRLKVLISIINNDGNLIECVTIAVISALAHFRLPQVKLKHSRGKAILRPVCDELKPLNFNFIPMCISLGLLEKGQHIVVDPTKDEASVCDCNIIIYMDLNKKVFSAHFDGSMLIDEKTAEECKRVAFERAREIINAISATFVKASNRDSSFHVLCLHLNLKDGSKALTTQEENCQE